MHWFRYPAIFGVRCLPVSVCDELIGMLSYGCAGKAVYLWLFFVSRHGKHRKDHFKPLARTIRR